MRVNRDRTPASPFAVDAALERFFPRNRQVRSRFDLARMEALLAALGNPHRACPPCVHVAGTNGKGSIIAFARAVAEAAGLRVHAFTSPHLVRANERIRLAGRLAANEDICAVLDVIAATGLEPTYFEALAACAFVLFSRHPADLALVETGAGGERDATNVMPSAEVAVIAAIARDHETLFGVRGIAGIARVKAGIMRSGRSVVITRQSSASIDSVLCGSARDIGAVALRCGRDWQCGWREDGFFFLSPSLEIEGAQLALAGRHQADNAGAALAALVGLAPFLPAPIGAEAARAGLRRAVWPGRMTPLLRGPLTGPRDVIVVDAAHNPAGTEALASEISARGRRSALVMAIGADKDAEAMLAPLAVRAAAIHFPPFPGHGQENGGRGHSPGRLAAIATELGCSGRASGDIAEALGRAVSEGDDAYVCGSLYLVGEVLKANEQWPD